VVVFDANMLIALVSPDTPPEHRSRLNHLVNTLGEARSYVGIPAPAFSEFMVDSEQATSEVLAALRRKQWIRFLPLDEKAAIEAAFIARSVIARSGKKRGASKKTWQQIKVDRQIVAIAKANGADAVYSDDAELRTEARSYGIQAHALIEIPLPPEEKQLKLGLEAAAESAQADGSSHE
jgi:predicted nucleic acid-binding protein